LAIASPKTANWKRCI